MGNRQAAPQIIDAYHSIHREYLEYKEEIDLVMEYLLKNPSGVIPKCDLLKESKISVNNSYEYNDDSGVWVIIDSIH